MSVADIQKNMQGKMEQSITALKNNLVKIRTGRANPALLDSVHVEYYGSMVPMSQVANVSTLDARTLSVQPWEKGLAPKIEKAIRDSDLGLNPSSMGEIEDEFDDDEEEGDIYNLADGSFRVSGDTPIERINEHFEVDIHPSDSEDEDEFDTIGGLIAHEMGHVPRRGEHITLCGLNFLVMHTQGGVVRWFKVTPAVACA